MTTPRRLALILTAAAYLLLACIIPIAVVIR